MDEADMYVMTVMHHLEIEGTPGESGIVCAQMCAQRSIDYLFGSWRDHYEYRGREVKILDAQGCRQRLPWFDVFHEGLCAALLGGEADTLDRLLQWAGDDLPFDDGAAYVKGVDNGAYVVVGMGMRGLSSDATKKMREFIKTGPSRKANLFVRGYDAIEAGDAAALGKTLVELVKHHRKRRFHPQHPQRAITIEGTILWQLALRAGLKLPSLDEAVLDHIMRPETLV